MALLDFIDKLDDIIYEPVKVVCDYARAPLQVAEKYTDAKKKEFEDKLKKDMDTFEMELGIKQRRGMIEAEAYERMLNTEQDKIILEAIKQYQIDMAEAATKIGNTLGTMNIELRAQAHNLIVEKTKSYKQIQDDAKLTARNELKQNMQDFPAGDPALDIMNDAVREQLSGIIRATNKFINDMADDLQTMCGNIDSLTKGLIEGTQNMLSASMTKSISSHVSSQAVLENKSEVRYLN